MWRIIQNFPRAAFRNFSGRPVRKCRDDEKDTCHKLHHAGQIAVPRRLSHNKVILSQVYRYPDEEQAKGSNGSSSRSEEQNRRRNFTQDFWSNLCKNNTVEAVGWGALVIVGLQLSRIYPSGSYPGGENRKNPYCPFNWIELAVRFIQDKPSWQCSRRVICEDSRLQFETILREAEAKEQAQHSFQETTESEYSRKRDCIREELRNSPSLSMGSRASVFSIPEVSSKEVPVPIAAPSQKLQLENVAVSSVDTEKRQHDVINADARKIGVDQAARDWYELTQHFTSLILNQAGMEMSRDGKYADAMALWEKSGASGFATAHYNLAVCYENGRGVPKNMAEAQKHYELAAERGHIKSQYNLALLYLTGAEGVNKDPQRALQLLESAAKEGFKLAQTELGVLYTEEERKDLEKAASLFRMAAEQQDKDGLYYLGICYENGWGVVQNPCKAAELYRQAAKAGHATAQYNLAVFFEHGLGGLPEDKKTAADMYEKAELLGEHGAENEAKRLRKDIERLELEEKFRWQFDGGTLGRLSNSRSSPELVSPTGSPTASPTMSPKPSLTGYLQSHLVEFGFADLATIDLAPKGGSWSRGRNSISSSGSTSGSARTSNHVVMLDDDLSSGSSWSSTSGGSYQITFQLGADSFEDLRPDGLTRIQVDDREQNYYLGQKLGQKRGRTDSSVSRWQYLYNENEKINHQMDSLTCGQIEAEHFGLLLSRQKSQSMIELRS